MQEELRNHLITYSSNRNDLISGISQEALQKISRTSYSYLPLFKISGNRRLILATNFKSGCSTMGKSIECSSYICIDDLLKGKPVFSVTRNPFSRFMCSYLRYYLPRRNEHFKSLDDSQLNIDSYIDWLFGYRDDLGSLESLDPHQRPQHYNLGIGKVPYDFVGNLERTDLVEKYLQKFGYRQLKRAGTQTNAANRYKSELSKEQSFRVVDLFEKDFEFFGYSKDIDSDKISIYKEASCVRGIDQKFVLSTFLRYATVFPADGCLPHCRDKITKGLSSIFSIIVKNSSSQMSGVAGVSLPNELIPLHLLLMPAYGQVHRFNEIIYNMLFSQLPTQDVEQNDFHAVLACSRESGDFESFFYYKQLSLYASKLVYDNCLNYNEEGGNIKLSFRQTTNSGIGQYYHSGMSVK